MEDLDVIAAVPGVDGLFLGPFDLCLSLGLNPMKMPFPEVEGVTRRALAVGRERGVAVGAAAGTPEQLRQLQSQGFTLLGYGPDYRLLAEGARAGLAAFRDQVTGGVP